MSCVELDGNRCGEYTFGGVKIFPNLTKDVSSEIQREGKTHVDLSGTNQPVPIEQRALAQLGEDLLSTGGGLESESLVTKNRTSSEIKDS